MSAKDCTSGTWSPKHIGGGVNDVYEVRNDDEVCVAEYLTESDAHMMAASKLMYAAISEAIGPDLHFLDQAATFIGGLCDAYKLTGEAKATAELYFEALHAAAETLRAAIAAAEGREP